MEETLYVPVLAGLWQQHELWDGTYTLNDLLDIVEVLAAASPPEG